MRALARLEATNMHKATEFRLEAHPLLPEPLERLEELANDLFYS